jgi:hypothetical protein
MTSDMLTSSAFRCGQPKPTELSVGRRRRARRQRHGKVHQPITSGIATKDLIVPCAEKIWSVSRNYIRHADCDRPPRAHHDRIAVSRAA